MIFHTLVNESQWAHGVSRAHVTDYGVWASSTPPQHIIISVLKESLMSLMRKEKRNTDNAHGMKTLNTVIWTL